MNEKAPELEYFDFGEALRELKEGCRVCRMGWNGKGYACDLMIGATSPEMIPGQTIVAGEGAYINTYSPSEIADDIAASLR